MKYRQGAGQSQIGKNMNTKNIAVINDSLDPSVYEDEAAEFNAAEYLAANPLTTGYIEFALEAHKNNDHMVCEYMDEAELASIIASHWNNGGSQAAIMREVNGLCDDGWDD